MTDLVTLLFVVTVLALVVGWLVSTWPQFERWLDDTYTDEFEED